MPHSDRTSKLPTVRRVVAAVGLVLATAPAATAHSIVFTRGELTANDSQLEARLEFSTHDLAHARVGVDDASVANVMRTHIVSQIVIRDDAGARLELHELTVDALPTATSAHSTPPGYRVSAIWRLPRRVRFLALGLAPSSGAALPNWNLQLALVRSVGEPPEETLQLAPGGAEVLDLQAFFGVTAGRALLPRETFDLGMVELHPTAARPEVHIVLPTALLDRWDLSPNTRADSVAYDDVVKIAPRICAWVVSHARLDIDGETTALVASDPELLAPEGAVIAATAANETPGVVCRSSARVRIVLRPRDAVAPKQRVDFGWDAFNAGVLRYIARVADGAEPRDVAELTPRQTEIVWKRVEGESAREL